MTRAFSICARQFARTLTSATVLAALSVLSACGGDYDSSTSSSNSAQNGNDRSSALAADLSGQIGSTMTKAGGVMELTVSGLGGNHPQAEAKWVGQTGASSSGVVSFAGDAKGATKSLASTQPLLNFLDVAPLATSTVDQNGFRYIATTIRVRNAPSCATPGACAPYATPRQNVTFFGVMMADTINQTPVSRFRRFDGSSANPALATQLLPMHGLASGGGAVDANLASLNVYRESEVPAGDPGVISVFPYGFVVRNAGTGSRILPANPASGQYDGLVTFGFRIPLQANPADDPFKISMRFQTADDGNLRTTQSIQEQSFAGDLAATSRTLALTGIDLAVLGGRIAQTTVGDPICSVRTAGTAAAPTTYLVSNVAATPSLAAAPMNLSFVDRTSEVSLGFCEQMNPPSASSLYVYGSQSGMRRAGAAYAGSLTGGGATTRPNQLVWNIAGQKPFFAGEEVSFIATAGNTAQVGGTAIAPFVGSFKVKGSNAGSAGTFGAASNFNSGVEPYSVALGDINGDGVLDMVTANINQMNVSVQLGNGAGGFSAPTNLAAGVFPWSVALGDLNGDGRIDIAVANNFSGTVSVLINNGTGGFAAATNLTVDREPTGIAIGDVNGDGRLDIVTANSVANSVSVLINNGAGGFAAATNLTVGRNPQSIALGDLNGDGRLDIVVAAYSSSAATVLLGTGGGGFAAANDFAVDTNPISLTLGDVNGDGRLDIVTANIAANNVSVLLGNGAGGFAAASNFAVANQPAFVVLGDVNGDGRLDIVAANYSSDSVSVRFGNGAGNFGAATNFTVPSRPISLALGDLNGDGKLDLASANFGASSTSLLLGL